jgi:hypothetical protein
MPEPISEEDWLDLSKKLRNRVSGNFNPTELETVDRFIDLARASFDQISQRS